MIWDQFSILRAYSGPLSILQTGWGLLLEAQYFDAALALYFFSTPSDLFSFLRFPNYKNFMRLLT